MREIPVYAPWISDDDVEAIRRVAVTGWISSGSPDISCFEQEFAAVMGASKAIACSSGTAALHLALHAAGIGPGDEVVVPDLTFVATASMVVACGAKPVFADISAHDWNLTPESVSRCLTPRTRAIIAVHLYGNPADCAALAEAAPGVMIVEDAAQACGASRKGLKAGTLGRFGCFSFFGNKIITTGEGGMVVTDDKELAARMQFLRGHAMAPERRYFHPELGFNYRMTGMQAALGRSQLRRIDDILSRKRLIAKLYAERLGDLPELRLHPVGAEDAQSIFWMYSIVAPSEAVRDLLAAKLRMENIDTRPFFCPMSSLPPFSGNATDAPVSRELSIRGINLPSGPLLTVRDIDFVTDTIREALGRSKPSNLRSMSALTTALTAGRRVAARAVGPAGESQRTRRKRAVLPAEI